MSNLIADYPCEFALRSGVVCVVPHDGFHVEKDAVDFVIILTTVFPVSVDIAFAFHSEDR